MTESETTQAKQPDIVVVQSSPLTAAPALGDMDHVLSTDYTLGFSSEGAAPDPRNVYDLQDEFYLPLTGFQRIDRPGPNLKVYVRRGEEPGTERRVALTHRRLGRPQRP